MAKEKQELFAKKATKKNRGETMKRRAALGVSLQKLGSDLGVAELLSDKLPTEKEGNLLNISVHDIIPGEYQPRRSMDDFSLEELANSIRTQGIIQPIIVRRKKNGLYVRGRYHFLCGIPQQKPRGPS